MKQRLIMAASFIHDPQVLVVDEPMVGLDPKGARLIKSIFRERCGKGATVFMSTHTLEVAQEMCDRIGIIMNGKLIALGSMAELQELSHSDQPELEPIFLKLTGDGGFRESEAGQS
jgi:ABC-2 type transport system ATP-binding protein